MSKTIVHTDDLPLFRSVGEQSLASLGSAIEMPNVSMRGRDDGDFVALNGRLTNMLYVPGVEGFVFRGGVAAADKVAHKHLHLVN